MLENFQLLAIVSHGEEPQLLQIPLHQELQTSLSESWEKQYNEFMEGIEEIELEIGYKPEQNQRFRLQISDLPLWFSEVLGSNFPSQNRITDNKEMLEAIKGVVALATDENGNKLAMFQNFNRSHVIQPTRSLFLEHEYYKTYERPGMTLDNKLSAVYLTSEKKLLFRNFQTSNRFLPLTEINREASDAQIREILEHDNFATENVEDVISSASQWTRRRFAMLRESQLLDKYTSTEIQNRSRKFDVEIIVNGDQIVFPADRSRAKRLLQFLNEEIYRGAITDVLYETNSKRSATD